MRIPVTRKFALWLLAGCGIFQIGTGLYFIGLRPAMLPEDERFIGATLDALAQVSPSLPLWLNRVFVVLGGHIVATGLLIVLTAILVWRHRENPRTAVALMMAAGLASIVLMSAVNFVIHSDFKWLLLLPALAWTAAVLLLAIDSRKPAEAP